jgi:hypothetical protein
MQIQNHNMALQPLQNKVLTLLWELGLVFLYPPTEMTLLMKGESTLKENSTFISRKSEAAVSSN